MEILVLFFNIFIVLFVVSTMLSIGFGLNVLQIIAPLKKPLLVINILVMNFIFIPFIVLLLIFLIPMDEGTKIGLILLSLAAGAPFTPKLVEIAKGDIALATAVMLLQMIATVLILPFALPLMLQGDISVDSMSIAKSLIVMMIIPLISALWIKVKFETVAKNWQRYMVKLSNLALGMIIVLMIILHGKEILAIFGYDMIAVILFIVFSLFIGYIAGGKFYHNRVVSSLSAGQRNISAALVVAAQNFTDPKVSIAIIAVSVIGLFILIGTAKQYTNKRE